MSHQIEVGYAVVEVPDPSALGSFFTDLIGLAPSEPTVRGNQTWTDDRAVQRVIVTEGPANDLVAFGVEAVDDTAFDATLIRLGAAGFRVDTGDELREERRVQRIATVDAPWGNQVEIVTGLERTTEPAPTPSMPGGFLTDGQGFGHLVIGTMAFDDSVRFVTDGLGMEQSDWIETELAPGIDLEVRFFHCNARHHSLALARVPFELPQTLHHLMFETNERDDVGAAFDRAFASGLPIPNGLGRHDNDRMFSFYVQSPAGFQVEVGHGARLISEPWTDDRRYDRISAWGHQPVTPAGAPPDA
jgi:2,3-dihydroxybiphenyl 1,2-dioxygenase